MNRIFPLLLIFCLFGTSVKAQRDTVLSRIVLIGDGGQLTSGKHMIADAVKRNIPLDEKTLVSYGNLGTEE